MNTQVNTQSIIINNFQQLRDIGQFLSKNSGICSVLIIEESMGLKEQLSKVIDTYFEDQPKALEEFLKIRDHIFAALADLDLNTKDIIDDLSDVFVDAVWLLEDEPQDSFEYVKSQVVPLGEIAISKIFFYALLKTDIDAAWIDNRDFVVTNDDFSQAQINLNVSKEKWKQLSGPIANQTTYFVMQSSVGSTIDNITTSIAPSQNISTIF